MNLKRYLTSFLSVTMAAGLMLAGITGQAFAAPKSTWQHCPNISTVANCTVTVDVVNARSQPHVGSTAVYQYQARQWIMVDCWVRGDNVSGDNIWYYTHPEGGSLPWAFVSGYLLDTGHDPYPSAPEC